MGQFESQPPSWALALFRYIVHPEFREEIEGDLLEKYLSDLKKYGMKAARRRFYVELFSVFRPNLVLNLNRQIMERRNWFIFLLVTLGIVVASVAPFLPGPENDFSHAISRFVHVIGYIGLVFIPFGLIWLIIEIRNEKGGKLNKWTNGFYPSLLAMIPLFLFFPMQIAIGIHEPKGLNYELLIVSISITAFFIYRILKLKTKTDYKFNPAPLFIVLFPLIALLTSRFAVEKAAAISRESMILKSKPLIEAIDNYKIANGQYPEKLEALIGKYILEIPQLNIMGIRAYQYEKRNNSFQLSFEQLWHWNATEVVVYNSLGHDSIKGDYEKYSTKHDDWWYYMAD